MPEAFSPLGPPLETPSLKPTHQCGSLVYPCCWRQTTQQACQSCSSNSTHNQQAPNNHLGACSWGFSRSGHAADKQGLWLQQSVVSLALYLTSDAHSHVTGCLIQPAALATVSQSCCD